MVWRAKHTHTHMGGEQSSTAVMTPAQARVMRALLLAVRRNPPLLGTICHDLVGVVLQYIGSQSRVFHPLLILADRQHGPVFSHAALQHPTLQLSEVELWARALQMAIDRGQGHQVESITLQIDPMYDPDNDDDALLQMVESVLAALPRLWILVIRGPRNRFHVNNYSREWALALDMVEFLPHLRCLRLLRCEIADCDRQQIADVLRVHDPHLTELEMDFADSLPDYHENAVPFLHQVLGDHCPNLRVFHLAYPRSCPDDTLFDQLQYTQRLACAESLEILTVVCRELVHATWQRLLEPCQRLRQLQLHLVDPGTEWITQPAPIPFTWACSTTLERVVVAITSDLEWFDLRSARRNHQTIDLLVHNLRGYLPPAVPVVHVQCTHEHIPNARRNTARAEAVADLCLGLAALASREVVVTIAYPRFPYGRSSPEDYQAHFDALHLRLWHGVSRLSRVNHGFVDLVFSVRVDATNLHLTGSAPLAPVSESKTVNVAGGGRVHWNLELLPPAGRVRPRSGV